MKRLLDVALASAALLISSPAIAIAMVAIKLDSPGPAVFRHTRIGRGRRRIEVLKLRTMVAEKRGGSEITKQSDARITRVGRWLRKTKLDELPQLWNVLRGDMSLVGPRPEVPSLVESYRSEWQRLFDVRPGLTDLASITFRAEEELLADAIDHERAYREVIMPLKLRLALQGVEESSLLHDLTIIASTMAAIVGLRTSEQQALLDEARRQIELLNDTGEVT